MSPCGAGTHGCGWRPGLPGDSPRVRWARVERHVLAWALRHPGPADVPALAAELRVPEAHLRTTLREATRAGWLRPGLLGDDGVGRAGGEWRPDLPPAEAVRVIREEWTLMRKYGILPAYLSGLKEELDD